MLSLSCRLLQTTLRPISQIIPRQISTIGALYAAFTARDLSGGSHGEVGTLISRFIKHIALEKCKTDPLIAQKIKYSTFYPISDFRSYKQSILDVPTDQIPRLIIYTYTYKTNGDPAKVTQALNMIDSLCLDRLEEMDHDTLLSVLYSFMFLLPNKITKFEFYPRCIQRLVVEMRDDCTKERFVEICFYLGLWKKHRRSTDLMNRVVKNHLDNYIQQLTVIEFAIVVSSLFKSSTVCTSASFRTRLLDEVLACDGDDDSILITFMKSARLNRMKSEKIFDKILNLNSTGKLKKMQFKGVVHIFAVLADGFYNDPKVCASIIEMCMDKLMKTNTEYMSHDVRAKDLTTFIWSCATLRCREHLAVHFEYLTDLVLHKLDRDEYKYAQDDLIDTVLSLWMLGYKSRSLVQAVFDLRNIAITENVDRVKLDSRFELLKSCIHIEEPNWLPSSKKNPPLFDEQRTAPNYLIERQPNLQNLWNTIEENKDELGVKEFKYVAPIHQLNIVSILLELNDGKKCFVDALEDGHTLMFGGEADAFVDLKLRLLDHLNYSACLVPSGLNQSEILSYLKECISNTNAELSRDKRVV